MNLRPNKMLLWAAMIISTHATADPELAGGTCTTTLSDEAAAHDECREALIPDRPHYSLSLPGGLFVGGLFFSSKARNYLLLVAPQVSVSGGATVPLHRPEVALVGIVDGKHTYRISKGRHSASDLLFALNGSLSGGLAYGDADHGVSGSIGSGAVVGLALAYQRYWVWFSRDGTETGRVGFSLGGIVGYMNTAAVGDAMIVALQPTFIIAGG